MTRPSIPQSLNPLIPAAAAALFFVTAAAGIIIPRPISYPLIVEAKSSQFVEAVRTLRDGQTLRLVGGGDVTIPHFFTIAHRRNIRIIAAEPVTLTGGQVTIANCDGLTLENFRIYPLGDLRPRQIAAYNERWNGLEGRALYVGDSRNVTIRNCTFAACADDMAGVAGDCERILYDRCLFAFPLGVWGQGFLAVRGPDLPFVPDWFTLRECVIAAHYRAPKIDPGGLFSVERCILAGMHYRPIEIKSVAGGFTDNWFYPMTACDSRPIVMGGPGPSLGLTLSGNSLYGRPAGWTRLVGMPGRSPIDKQNTVPLTALDRDILSDGGAGPTAPSMEDVLTAAGTRGPPDEIESAARWFVRLMAAP